MSTSLWGPGDDRFCLNGVNVADGRVFLGSIGDGLVSSVFFDPQYRGVMDRLKYGNEGVRQSDRLGLPQMSSVVISEFIEGIFRVLKPSGYLFFWTDKFEFAEGVTRGFCKRLFACVDLIVWQKGTFGMGARTRRSCEYLVVFQKPPLRGASTWMDHGIRDVWYEKTARGCHAHGKPVELQRRLILSVTRPGEIVVDPSSGGYSVLRSCELAGRDFAGCDLIEPG